MTKKNLTKALLWLLCALIFTPSVRASSLYGVEFSTGTGFYRVNQSTGAISLLGNTGNSFTGDLASDLVSTIWTPDMNADTLLTINPANGAITSTTNLRTAAGAPVNI